MKRNGMKKVLLGCAAIAWWGLLYPELTVLPDTYRVVCEGDEPEEAQQDRSIQWDLTGNAYWKLVEAGSDKICLKSRFAEVLSDWIRR